MLKQAIILRSDIGMSVGKLCVQACHASIGSCENVDFNVLKSWKTEGQKKIVLEVQSRDEIVKLYKKAKDMKIPCFLVKDAGLTELKPGTITALGIGPDNEEKINKITGSLKLL